METATKGKYTIMTCNGQTKDKKGIEYLNQSFVLRYQQMILTYNPQNTNEIGIDKDEYDSYCDHLLIIDNDNDKVVGVYRLITSKHITNTNNKFLSEAEFNFDVLKNYNLLEVGRVVVDKEYRNGQVISLLWRGVINYAVKNSIDYLIGTASFYGIDYIKYSDCFSYLYYNNLTHLNIYAINNWVRLQTIDIDKINERVIRNELPPLIKGYLRLGATIGNGVYLDTAFNSCDVFIILDINNISARYLDKYLNRY